MSLVIVVGTRPDIVKMSPVVQDLCRQREDFEILHTDQHFDEKMDGAFLKELGYPMKKLRRLKTSHLGYGAQLRETFVGARPLFNAGDVVVVYGDTMSAAVVTVAARIALASVVHVEAGLRSYDVRMPEETFRCVIDSLAHIKLCPTELQYANLAKENMADGAEVVGNTIQDVVWKGMDRIRVRRTDRMLVTLHRPENVDDRDSFLRVMKTLDRIRKAVKAKMVWPLHPRTWAAFKKWGFAKDPSWGMTGPMTSDEFLRAEAGARIVATDSGGVQEETYILGVPCVTLRRNTERPETLRGCNVLMDVSISNGGLKKLVDFVLSRRGELSKPYGSWPISEQIAEKLVCLAATAHP